MKRVNRSAIVIQPRQPFVDWINRITATPVTLAELDEDHSCYLLPEVLSRREMKEYFEQYFWRFWEEELSAWSKDQKLWPARSSFTGFLEWFKADFHTTVYDILEKDLWATDEDQF